MTDLFFHNTLTGELEPFVPMQAGRATAYVCGITPYDETHLGHARCYVVFDVLKRVLKSRGFEVTHVQNFTDVDDKIIERARQKKVPPLEYPKKFIDAFKTQMARLNVLPADKYPLVTTHLPQIVKLVASLVDKGLAYPLEGSVYFRVRAFDESARRDAGLHLPAGYGTLSRRDINDLEAGARVEVNDKKKDPLDFALWKKSKEGEPAWPSPWGEGRPGWHIECSAMAMEYLGAEFDIHGGGLDLVFPHHSNEVAQSVGATGKRFAHLWMHNGFVTVNQEKMSKSLGNFFTLTDIFAKFDPMSVRYFLLTQHYRSPLNFSDVELAVADKTWKERVCGAVRLSETWVAKLGKGDIQPEPSDSRASFDAAMAHDLNTAEALGALNVLCTEIYTADAAMKAAGRPGQASAWTTRLLEIQAMLSVLGLAVPAEETWPEEILALVKERLDARAKKDWAASDRLRDALKAKGVVVEDKADGPRLKKA